MSSSSRESIANEPENLVDSAGDESASDPEFRVSTSSNKAVENNGRQSKESFRGQERHEERGRSHKRSEKEEAGVGGTSSANIGDFHRSLSTDRFAQTILQQDAASRPRFTRVRSSSPMGRQSQFGSPKVKNLYRAEKEKWSLLVFVLSYLKHMIPPVFSWAPKYQLSWFWNDFVAGLSTGVYGIPQTMALGVLAGLTPVDGLYTSLAPAIVYVLLGPSRSMSVGPVSVISLMVGNAISSSASPALMATSINFFMGIIFLGLGLLRVGFLSALISRPVVVGFTSAAAILVDTTQVKHILGLKAASNSHLIDFFKIMVPAIRKGPINGWATLVGLSCLFFLISLRFHPRLKPVPGPVVVTVLWILLTWGFKLNKIAGIAIVGNIPSGLPVPQLPFAPAKELSTLVGSLIVISAISLVEIVSISKTFAVKAGTIINTNTELIAVGAAAVIGSFFRAFPISASFSRTALNDSAGAKSQFSSVVSALIVVFVLVFAKAAVFYLPMTVLASIVIAATLNLFDTEEMIFIWRTSKRDFFVLFIAFTLTLLLGPEYGVLIAVCLNIFFMLFDQYRMKTRELGQMPFELSDALFDVIHPDIEADEAEEAEELQEMKPGTRVQRPKSDAIFVIKDYFPEAFTHPHLLIIRPTDSLTYINVDNWVMHVVSDALERLPQQWNVEGSTEVSDLRLQKKEWELARRLKPSVPHKRAGSDANESSNGASRGSAVRASSGSAHSSTPPNSKKLRKKRNSSQSASEKWSPSQPLANAHGSSSDDDSEPNALENGAQEGLESEDSIGMEKMRPVQNAKEELSKDGDEEETSESSYSSIEESFTASYTHSGKPHKLQPISIIQNGKVRFAEKGELNEGDEEKIEEESNRKEIKALAEKTRNLQGFVIIDMIHMNSMDSIVVGRLRDLYKTLAFNNISLAIARPRPVTLKYLIRGKFVSLIGQDFVVDSINTCVIRCNAVLRAALRFQALKLLEMEEDEEHEEKRLAGEPKGEEAV